jgi:hypothetical protein
MQNLMQTYCSILPSIADKTKREVEKALMLKQCVFTVWCHVADWCNRLAEVWPWPPLSSSFTEAVTTITTQELSLLCCLLGFQIPGIHCQSRNIQVKTSCRQLVCQFYQDFKLSLNSVISLVYSDPNINLTYTE